MNAAESLAYYNFQPSCSCNHDLKLHADGRQCRGLDSYELPCGCPSYFVEQEPGDRAGV